MELTADRQGVDRSLTRPIDEGEWMAGPHTWVLPAVCTYYMAIAEPVSVSRPLLR
jgi:hypothetical protein